MKKTDMEMYNSLPQSASLTAPSSEGALIRGCNGETIYALGFFDGVHLGHGALLRACRTLAHEMGCAAGVVTFQGHPEIPDQSRGNEVTHKQYSNEEGSYAQGLGETGETDG